MYWYVVNETESQLVNSAFEERDRERKKVSGERDQRHKINERNEHGVRFSFMSMCVCVRATCAYVCMPLGVVNSVLHILTLTYTKYTYSKCVYAVDDDVCLSLFSLLRC